jgi:integrase
MAGKVLHIAQNPYERIAAALYDEIATGRIEVGTHLTTAKAISASNTVSVGTANRAIALLKEWGLVEAREPIPGTPTNSNNC